MNNLLGFDCYIDCGEGATYRSASGLSFGVRSPTPHQPETKKRRTEQDQAGGLGRCKQLASDFTTREVYGVNVEISLFALDARNQRCLGLR